MKTDVRSKCVHCNKPYGSRITTSAQHKWPVEEDEPPIQVDPGRIISGRSRTRYPSYQGGRVHWVRWYRTWDGQSFYEPFRPFCTMRCALHYARRAWERWGISNP
jgi:hypothetical protein